MTIDEIKSLIQTSEYDFLRNNEHLGSNIIMLTLGGSHAYGTNIEGSDVDIRGCALNTKEEILTNKNFEQFTNDATDTTIYSFNKLVSLVTNANPNTIELLGNKPEHYLYLSPIGKEFIDNRHLFLSKKCIYSFGGKERYLMPDDSIKLYVDKSQREGYDTEIFVNVNLNHHPLRDYKSMWSEMNTIVKEYSKIGQRNQNAIEHGKLAKHMMHLVRLYLMCFDILEKQEIITYRETDHDFLMEIRNGKYLDENNQPTQEFFDLVDDLEARLDKAKRTSTLPDNPNYKKINEFVASVNERVVKGEI